MTLDVDAAAGAEFAEVLLGGGFRCWRWMDGWVGGWGRGLLVCGRVKGRDRLALRMETRRRRKKGSG